MTDKIVSIKGVTFNNKTKGVGEWFAVCPECQSIIEFRKFIPAVEHINRCNFCQRGYKICGWALGGGISLSEILRHISERGYAIREESIITVR